jgi:DNA-binding MarR family transcriptional regulator
MHQRLSKTLKPIRSSPVGDASKPFRVSDWPMHHLLMIERQHMANSNQLLKRRGIDHRIWRLLVNLDETDGASINDVADRGGFERTTLSKIADKAQAKGLVARVIEADDRRRTRLALTAKGRQMIELCKPIILGLYERYLRDLEPNQIEQLMRLLLKLRHNVEVEGVMLRKHAPGTMGDL